MKVIKSPEASASPPSGTGTDSGAPNVDLSALGKVAGQAGTQLSAASAASKGTGSKVLGAAGEGLRDAGIGAGIGASIGSVIPGIGTVIGGAVGAIGGALVGVFNHLFSGSSRKLPPKQHAMFKRALHVYKKRHLPGAFHDAVLHAYHPKAYKRLQAQRRLPSEVEAHLLHKRAYVAHARDVERHHGKGLRRELAPLPPHFRTLVGVGTITGHSRDLNVAMHRALNQPAPRSNGAPMTQPGPTVTPAPLAPASGGQEAPLHQPLPAQGNAGGEAGAPETSPVFMRSVVDVFDAGDAAFAWRPINVTFQRHPRDPSAQTLLGTFWVFADALKDIRTGLRVPCTAAETQIVADRIRVAPQDLPQWWGPSPGEALPSLLMTTRLLCARWLNARDAHQIIAPHVDSTSDLLIAGSMRMNRQIDADLARFQKPDPWPWVADPGKIRALHRRLFDGSAQAVNYGWHVDPVLTAVPVPLSSNAAIPGVSLLQSAGGAHSPYHVDYSQVLLLVAPWCMVAVPGQDQMVPMRTADVYQSRELAGLVTDDAQPLRGVRQPFDPNRMHAERRGFWAKQEQIYNDKRRRGLRVFDVLPRTDHAASVAQYNPTTGGTNATSPHNPFASLPWNRRPL